MRIRRANSQLRSAQAGFSLMELLMALSVLAVGMAGIAILVVTAMVTDYRNRNDTTATMLDQMVIGAISQRPSTTGSTVSLTDCGGNAWTIATAGATGTGNGATLLGATPSAGLVPGSIDWTQAYSAVAANYKMQYQTCTGFTYDVRWNVTTTPSGFTNQVSVSSRLVQSPGSTATGNALQYGIPVTLRTIVGQ